MVRSKALHNTLYLFKSHHNIQELVKGSAFSKLDENNQQNLSTWPNCFEVVDFIHANKLHNMDQQILLEFPNSFMFATCIYSEY